MGKPAAESAAARRDDDVGAAELVLHPRGPRVERRPIRHVEPEAVHPRAAPPGLRAVHGLLETGDVDVDEEDARVLERALRRGRGKRRGINFAVDREVDRRGGPEAVEIAERDPDALGVVGERLGLARDRAELDWIEDTKEREAEGKAADRERFFAFDFEPGNYFYAGRREFEGRDVVVVEYYPENAFDGEEEEEIERSLSKALAVTLLIVPEEHQVVRMTMENFGFDFLPAGWLVKVDTLEASMTMHQPFAPKEKVWLARDIEFHGRVRTASGDLGVRYRSTFGSCVKAEVKAQYQFPPRPRKKGS